MSKGTDRRTVRVAPELWESAQAVANKNDTTVSDIIRTALEAYTMHGSIYGDSAVRDAIRATYARPDVAPRAVVRRAYTAEGACGWDVLIEHPDGYFEWADRAATRDDARGLAHQWNQSASHG